MAKFDVSINIIVEANSSTEAFAMVRSNFCVVDDPQNKIKDGLYDMFVGEVEEVDEDDDVSDYA